ncbi:hypothetical protein AAFF_G00173780 [Aldrovandia affinis]|uniref:Uncharacterized protein n=1 Tax=Aldrovandia affinis TaxID=143900 RepID=A0AAD7WW24_9TELE|nr:hypothetical protein AAFF_G00173780 [Aldrovandia affinis]
MDNKSSLMGCCCVLLLVFAQMLRYAESTFIARRVGSVNTHAPGDFGARYDSLSRRGRRVQRLPVPVEEAQDDGGYSSGTFDPIRVERPKTRHGFAGVRRRHRLLNRSKNHRYGHFNSDTYGCSGIQSRSCRVSSDCIGCLGLYTCDVSVRTCKLKGLSQRTDAFFQSLQDT